MRCVTNDFKLLVLPFTCLENESLSLSSVLTGCAGKRIGPKKEIPKPYSIIRGLKRNLAVIYISHLIPNPPQHL